MHRRVPILLTAVSAGHLVVSGGGGVEPGDELADDRLVRTVGEVADGDHRAGEREGNGRLVVGCANVTAALRLARTRGQEFEVQAEGGIEQERALNADDTPLAEFPARCDFPNALPPLATLDMGERHIKGDRDER